MLNKAFFVSVVFVFLGGCGIFTLQQHEIDRIQLKTAEVENAIVALEDHSDIVDEVDKKAYRTFLDEASLLVNNIDNLHSTVNEGEKWRLFILTHANGTALYYRVKAYVKIRWPVLPEQVKMKLRRSNDLVLELNDSWIEIINDRKNLDRENAAFLLLDLSDVILDILLTLKFPEYVPNG